MRKLSIYLLVAIILLCFSMTVMGAETERIDLRSAIDTALKLNLELKIEKLNLKKAKLQYEKNKASNLLKNSRYSHLEAEYNLAAARNTYQNVHDQLVNDIIQQYTDIRLAELDLIIKEKKVKLERLLLNEAKAQYEIGDIGSIDLLEQENTFKDAEFNLETAQDDYQQSIKEFKTMIGLDNTELILEDLVKPGIWQIKEMNAVNTALNNSIILQLKQEEIELAKIDLNRAQVSSSKLDKKIKQVVLDTCRLEKDKIEEEISSSVQAAFYQFEQSVKRMKLKKERLTEAGEKYNLRKKQYEVGLLTKSDLLQYEINMMDAEYQYKAAIAGYYLKELSLRKAMNLETGVFTDESEGK